MSKLEFSKYALQGAADRARPAQDRGRQYRIGPGKKMKPFRLLSLLVQRPPEFFDRTAAILDARLEPYLRRRPAYSAQEEAAVVGRLGSLLSANLYEILGEPALGQLEEELQGRLRAMPPEAPFASFHNGDSRLARLCYALVRALRPETVIETGVCYGVTSSYILKALEQNSGGKLYSIDLPPLGKNADDFVGWLVPPRLKNRWRLIRGLSGEILPEVLKEIEEVDVFVHDSLHTYRNMRREFEIVTPRLGRPSAVISDDIEGNSAFLEWGEEHRPDFCTVLQEKGKKSLMGLGVFLGGISS
jgi:hypothetical protein